jgi:D-serine deaminase-like pyridoxal phosphate-dependent protein
MTESTVWGLDTPALVLDWPAAERNLRTAVAFVEHRPVRLRPHFKNHKCVTMARRQLAAGGCAGITCAKLAEAEILITAGIVDVLIANQVVGPNKIKRLVSLADRGAVRVAVDSLDNASAISAAASAAGRRIGLLIEVDIGMGRCGVAPGEPAVALARRIADLPGVSFDGLQAYEGHAMGIMDRLERSKVVHLAMQQTLETRERLEAAGFPVPIVSGGGTATYRITGLIPGFNELQLGSYATMDWTYWERVHGEFEMALGVLATVISTAPNRFVLDVGLKGIGADMGPPRLRAYPEFRVARLGAEEHCTVDAPGHQLKVGDKVELIPSHCCTTCNLHRQMIVHDSERIIDIWPIEASGALT